MQHDAGRHQFTLDDETYYALVRLTEQHNAAGRPFWVADDYLKDLVMKRDEMMKPPKGILEKVRDGEPI